MVQQSHSSKSHDHQQGLFGDFVASHPQQIADHVVRVLEGTLNRKEDVARSRQFVNGIVIALNADDYHPLTSFFEIAERVDAHRAAPDIERMFRYLDAFAASAIHVVEEERYDPAQRTHLIIALNEEMAVVHRSLILPYISSLTEKITKMQNAAQTSGTSLSITLHELRRPLTILSSYSQLLSAGMLGAVPEPVSVAIEGITSSTDLMIQLVNTLAEVSRLEDPDDEPNREDVAIMELISQAAEHISIEASLRSTEIALEVGDPELVIQLDRPRVIMALTNILSNALKHTPPGSTITIRQHSSAHHIHIIVNDQGPGFPQEDAEHLFEKYYRSANDQRRKVPGTGLGLFIVKSVIERHHGTVIARSQPDLGAEFEIVLPFPSEGHS